MAKNVLIISTSFRNNSNSEIMAKEVEKGAKDAGHNVEFVTLKDKNIQFCKGCLACQKLGHCVINDDANEITEKIKNADVVVWATPVYYYEMSGQMKYKFKEVYLITASADTGEEAVKRVINGVQGWIDCFSGVKFSGYACATVNEPDEVNSQPKSLQDAYNLGKNI